MISIAPTETIRQTGPSRFVNSSVLTDSNSMHQTNSLDNMNYQISLKEKKLEELLTEYEQLVLQSKVDNQEVKIATMMKNINHYEKQAYQQQYEISSLIHILERTKNNTDSLKAKAKSLQRYRDKSEILYAEASETEIEATKLFNFEYAKAQQYKNFIEETRGFRVKELNIKLDEVKTVTDANAKELNKSVSDIDGAIAKLRTQDIRKRLSYFKREKEKTTDVAEELRQNRMKAKFHLLRFYRVLGSFDIDNCLDVYNETIIKNSSLSVRTDELLIQIHKLMELEKNLRYDLKTYKDQSKFISSKENLLVDSKMDIICSEKHSEMRQNKSILKLWESRFRSSVDITIKVFMVMSSILHKLDKVNTYQVLGPLYQDCIQIDAEFTHPQGELKDNDYDKILMSVLLAEKKLVTVCAILYSAYMSRNLRVGGIVRMNRGFLYFHKITRRALKRNTFLDAFNTDISAKNVETIKKQIYNNHFLDSENNVPQIFEMISGAAQIAESSRKAFEKQGKKNVPEVAVDFDVSRNDDETLKRNSQLATISELNESFRKNTNSKIRRSADKPYLTAEPILLTSSIQFKTSRSARNLQTLPNLPKIHKIVKSLTTKTNRAKKEPETMSFKSIFEDIAYKKQEMLKTVDQFSPPDKKYVKLPVLTSPRTSEIKPSITKFTLKASKSQDFLKVYK